MNAQLVRVLRTGAVLACCAAISGACSRKDQASAAKGQVVAHIGKDVVTVQELENEFRWDNISSDRQKDPDVTKRVLGEVVLRKYLVQQALTSNLDREPGVLLDLLRSREQVLQSAYLNRKMASRVPDKAAIDRYVADSPSKFARRMVFTIEQIGFPIGPDTQPFIDASKDTKSLDDIDQKLTAAAVPHSRQMGVLSSSDLDPEFLASIEEKKADDVYFIRSGANGIFFKLTGEQLRPLEGEAAFNLARQLMRADALKAEAGMAAYAANIEAKYEGDYARIMQQVGAAEKGGKEQ